MPRPKSILGDTRIALMYSHMLASHWTIGWAMIISDLFLFYFFWIDAPVSSCSLGLYEEGFLYILKQRNLIAERN